MGKIRGRNFRQLPGGGGRGRKGCNDNDDDSAGTPSGNAEATFDRVLHSSSWLMQFQCLPAVPLSRPVAHRKQPAAIACLLHRACNNNSAHATRDNRVGQSSYYTISTFLSSPRDGRRSGDESRCIALRRSRAVFIDLFSSSFMGFDAIFYEASDILTDYAFL